MEAGILLSPLGEEELAILQALLVLEEEVALQQAGEGGGGANSDTVSTLDNGGAGGGLTGQSGVGEIMPQSSGGTQTSGYAQFQGANATVSGSYFAGGGGGYWGGLSGTGEAGDVPGAGGGSSYYGGSGVTFGLTQAGNWAVLGSSSDPDLGSNGYGGTTGPSGDNGIVIAYYGAANVAAISSPTGSSSGGETVTIYGLGFVNGTTVTIGGSLCSNVHMTFVALSE